MTWLDCVPTRVSQTGGTTVMEPFFQNYMVRDAGRTVSHRWGVLIGRGDRWRADEAAALQAASSLLRAEELLQRARHVV